MKFLFLPFFFFLSITPLMSQQPHKPFTNPGVIVRQGEKWAGSDYLGFLSNNIMIHVEVIQSRTQSTPLPIDSASLEGSMAALFNKAGIIPAARFPDRPPLPLLHILVMVYAIPHNAYLIFCEARLFEEVKVQRERFNQTAFWQAITWETQSLIVAQKDRAVSQVQELVDEVTNAFIKRYRLYNPTNFNVPSGPKRLPPKLPSPPRQ